MPFKANESSKVFPSKARKRGSEISVREMNAYNHVSKDSTPLFQPDINTQCIAHFLRLLSSHSLLYVVEVIYYEVVRLAEGARQEQAESGGRNPTALPEIASHGVAWHERSPNISDDHLQSKSSLA